MNQFFKMKPAVNSIIIIYHDYKTRPYCMKSASGEYHSLYNKRKGERNIKQVQAVHPNYYI